MRISILLILASFAICPMAESREWVDRTGKFKTQAEFVEVKGDNVVLKKSDGKQITVPIARLSDKDQAFIRQQMSKEAGAVTEVASSDADDIEATEAPKGTLFGEPFEAVAIKMQGDRLTFASDEEFIPSKSILLFLFAGEEKLAGRKFVVGGNTRGQSPHIHLKSKDPSKTEMLFNDYTMNLTFGKQQGRNLPGQIVLKIPEHKTTLSGKFVVEEPKNYKLPPTAEDAPFIVATPKFSASIGKPDYLTVGYIGTSKAGKRVSNLAGTGWSDDGYAASTTHEPRVTTVVFDKGTARAQHVKLEPGRYFHYLVLNRSFLVGEWVDVEADSQIEATLAIDSSDAGSLEVATASDRRVHLVPVDVLEGVDESKLNAMSLAYSMGLSAKPEDGKAVFDPIRPGKYILVTDKEEQTVEIAPGESKSIALAE